MSYDTAGSLLAAVWCRLRMAVNAWRNPTLDPCRPKAADNWFGGPTSGQPLDLWLDQRVSTSDCLRLPQTASESEPFEVWALWVARRTDDPSFPANWIIVYPMVQASCQLHVSGVRSLKIEGCWIQILRYFRSDTLCSVQFLHHGRVV